MLCEDYGLSVRGDIMDLSIEIMKAEYKKEAKKADQRLRALEEYARKYRDDKYLKYAYSRAMRDLASHGLGNRFDKQISKDIKNTELQKMLSDVRRFNESTTSTFTGFQKLDEQRYKALSDPNNTKARGFFPEDLTEEEFLKITQLGVWDLLSEDFNFGYQTAIKIAKELTRNKKFIMNRKTKMKYNSMLNILKKYKFSANPEIGTIVQGTIKAIEE